MLWLIGTVLTLGVGYYASLHWYTDIRPILFGKVITDPDDPRFDPAQFRFEYYGRRNGNEWDLPKALLKMFPPGTDKAYIDGVLTRQGHVEIVRNETSENNPSNYFSYMWPTNGSGLTGVVVSVDYNNNKSTTIHLGGNRLYESEKFRYSYSVGMQQMLDKQDRIMAKNNEAIEQIMRPIRKKYIGIEDGLLKQEKRNVGQ